jgi:hypothetical protein
MFTSNMPNPVNPQQPLSATALFSLTGNQLTITVNNTAGPDTQRFVDAEVLTGIYFSPQPLNNTTTPQVVNAATATVCAAACDSADGWEYSALTVPNYGLFNGISAVQYPVFLSTSFVTIGRPVGGKDYGVVSNPDTGTIADRWNEGPYSMGSATFVLNVPNSFALNTIDRVVFAWATSDQSWSNGANGLYPSDAAPEPSSLLLTAAAASSLFARKFIRGAKRRRPA